jgi:hypothetical protein
MYNTSERVYWADLDSGAAGVMMGCQGLRYGIPSPWLVQILPPFLYFFLTRERFTV